MIRLLHVISDTNIGGAGLQMMTLLKGLDKSKFEIKVVVPIGAKLAKHLQLEGISFEEIPHIADKSFSVRAVFMLHKVIKTYKPHIVHSHAALSARIAARICRASIVNTRHSVFPTTKMQKLAKPINFYMEELLGGKTIAVSPAAKVNLVEMGVSDLKITVIYNGVPEVKVCTEKEKQRTRARFDIPPDVFLFAKIARLDQVKGHDYLLDAAKKCRAYFLFAGTGEQYDHLAKRIKDESIHNVRLPGFVEKIEDILNVMDAGVLASYGTEATSLSLLQGMSLGKPAIVTDYGGNPYVIEHEKNGLLVPVKNSDSLSKAMDRLMKDKRLYDTLGKNAKKTYKKRFTETIMVNQTTELYEEWRHL